MIASLPLLAVLSGLSFALVGVAYRFGQNHRITPIQIIVWAAPLCIVFFGAQTPLGSWAQAPRAVWLWAIAGGMGQYLCLLLVNKALRLGPLSPLWCTTNLTFLMTVLFAALFLDERITLFQALGLASGIGAVLAGVWSVSPTSPTTRTVVSGRLGQRLEYALILGLLMLCNSLPAIAIKALSRHVLPSGGDALSHFSGVFTTTIYITLWLSVLTDMALRSNWRRPNRSQIGLAALASGGSIGGFLLWCFCAAMPAAILFTLSSIASVIGSGLVSVFLFREKASGFWFLMMGLAVLTVILLNMG